jgi:hypothetical protein
MPVFISHRTKDDQIAQQVGHRLLHDHKILCYIDHVDPEASRTPDITNLLVSRIKQCTHLLAIVTDATHGSWWVPFEIGVARQADRRIATYDASHSSLPEFLQEWPILVGMSAVDTFAILYHKDTASRSIHGRTVYASKSIQSASQFHRELKSALGQR